MTDNLFGPLCILIYLFVLDWRMALLSLVSIPVGMLFMMLVMIGYGEKYAGSVRTAQEMNFMDSLAKIGTIVGTVDEILNGEEQNHSERPVKLEGMDIALESVSFDYHEGQEILHDVSLNIPAGTMTAFVGLSGSGLPSPGQS